MPSFSYRLCVAFVLLAAGAVRAQTQADFFDDTGIQELRIEMRPSDWTALKAAYLENTYYPADMHWKFQGRDIALTDIGVRSRGWGSRSPFKPNLRLDFNRYEDKQTFLGLKSAVMKANNQDASMLRERTTFKLWERTGMPVPRESFTRLYVNNEYIGVYLLTEEIRDDYLARTIGEGAGDLYEWQPEVTYHWEWNPTCNGAQVACSTSPAKWNPVPLDAQENKKTFDIAPTINMFRTFTEASDADFDSRVSALVDFKLLVSHVATEVAVSEFDSILSSPFGTNNFWIYRYDKTNFHQFLLWDKDGSYSWSTRPIFYDTEKNTLMKRALAVPARRNQYLEAMYKAGVMMGGQGGWMEWYHQQTYDRIKQAVYDDPNKRYSDQGVQKANTNTIFDAAGVYNLDFLKTRSPMIVADSIAAGLQFASVKLGDGGAVNAATNVAGPVSPGSGVSLYGSGFATQTIVAAASPLPTRLGGVSVLVNGFPAPLLFVSPNQINIQVPWELGLGNGTTPFTVVVDGAVAKGTVMGSVNQTFSNSVSAPVKLYAPGVYAVFQGGSGRPVVSEPAGSGDVLVVYCNGLGPVTVPVATGGLAPTNTLSYTKETPRVTIDGQNAEVAFSGLTPGTAGVYQINLTVPQGVKAGGAPLVIEVGGERSPAVTIATR